MRLSLSKLLSRSGGLLFLIAFGVAAATLLSVTLGPTEASHTQIGMTTPPASSVTDNGVVLSNKNNNMFGGGSGQQPGTRALQGTSVAPPATNPVTPVAQPAPTPVYYPPLPCSCRPIDLSAGEYNHILCPEGASGSIACSPCGTYPMNPDIACLME